MTKTPKWLPDGHSIDPESLNGDTVVETVNGFCRARHAVFPIVRVFADVTPPKPDPRVEVVAQIDYTRDDIRTMHDGGTSWHEIAERLRVPLDDKCKAPSCEVLHEVTIDGEAVTA